MIKVRDTHKFKYADEKCVELAKKIKELVDDKSRYADWFTRDDIKNELIYAIDDLSTYSSAATDDFTIDNDIIDFMRYKLETWFNPDDNKPVPDDEETVSSIMKKTVNKYAVDRSSNRN